MASTFPDLNSRSLSRLKLAIGGGGVWGLSIAAVAARCGAVVSVFEPRPIGDNASGVAAGMLSPIFEAALDGGSVPDHVLFEEGYAAWPRFAEALDLAPPTDYGAGALYVAGPVVLDPLAGRLTALGVEAERLTGAAARSLQPALAADVDDALHVRRDGRLDPMAMLATLAARLCEAGGEVVQAPLPSAPARGFDATVLAAGYGARRWLDLAPELAVLQPIKGHVLQFDGGPASGPTVRSEDGYAAPQRRGAIFGATMEPGRSDLALDPAAIDRLHAAAMALLPNLKATPYLARTGVRAATPDGRPLVGRTSAGLHLAVGARRNGWLLAPVIAAAVLRELQGGAPRKDFAPSRFNERPHRSEPSP